MRGKVVVFPIRGRNWCFSRSIDPSVQGADAAGQFSNGPSTFKELYDKLFSSSSSRDYDRLKDGSKLEIAVDFVANKMNQSWTNIGKAPKGTIKNKIHGLGLKLLSRVKPSEIFFRSIGKEMSALDVTYPSSLNRRLVHRRLRHLASKGSIVHKNYFYGSAVLLPFTTIFMILPFPNIPFFWVLFRSYCHWRASQGSEKLLYLLSEPPIAAQDLCKRQEPPDPDQHHANTLTAPYVLQPSEELQRLIQSKSSNDEPSERTISEICKVFHLDPNHVFKYGQSVF